MVVIEAHRDGKEFHLLLAFVIFAMPMPLQE
jgi:hypothetical protein